MTTQILGCVLIVAAPALKPPKDQPPPIVGKWILTEYTQNGSPLAIDPGTATEFQADGKRRWYEGRELATDYERGYKLVPKANPPALDLLRSTDNAQAPDVFPCIYRIDGDTLTVTISDIGGKRPTLHGDGWRVMKYVRAKKE
jgi:uncharacterized protein (TIGR03067 family)